MAETMETPVMHENVPSNSKVNAALSTGIIGTALSALGILGGGAMSLCNNNNKNKDGKNNDGSITGEENYIERKQAQDYLNITKEFYEGKLDNQKALADAFFDAYKRDIDNSFSLYKNQRDNFDILNQKITDSSFGLYKNHRDDKDSIMASIYATNASVNDRINKLQNTIDVMQAVRPYQDALINCKIDKNALESDFKLAKRTCRMIEGQLVLPDNLVSGFTSYNVCGMQ